MLQLLSVTAHLLDTLLQVVYHTRTPSKYSNTQLYLNDLQLRYFLGFSDEFGCKI